MPFLHIYSMATPKSDFTKSREKKIKTKFKNFRSARRSSYFLSFLKVCFFLNTALLLSNMFWPLIGLKSLYGCDAFLLCSKCYLHVAWFLSFCCIIVSSWSAFCSEGAVSHCPSHVRLSLLVRYSFQSSTKNVSTKYDLFVVICQIYA